MELRCCLFLPVFLSILVCSLANSGSHHKLAKRQTRNSQERAFPLSRSRQFPPPEELQENEENYPVEDDYQSQERRPIPHFRGQQVPPSEDYSDSYLQTEAPLTTTPSPTPPPTQPPTTKPPNRRTAFNRLAGRPRFGLNSLQTTTTTTAQPSPAPPKAPLPSNPTSSGSSRFRSRFTQASTQRIDIAAEILNHPQPPRPAKRSTTSKSPTSTEASDIRRSSNDSARGDGRRISNGRTRVRGRGRTRTSSTTTTTTTTTTQAPLSEEYYYYYYDDEESQPVATTTTTTTTTTTPRPPSLPRRPSLGRRPTNSRPSTSRPAVKFDPDAIQFQPPPDDAPVTLATSATKRFTTSTTEAPGPGGIPAHLRGKYKPRTDGRFIDFLRDPNRPRELKGFDLTSYPFYIRVPEDITFDCGDMKDGYYASVPHHCQLFHYCFAGARYDFLCANYTLYDQTTFTCRFANNVDCPSSAKYYYRNDDLWKETTTIAPEEQKKKKPSKVDDEEEEEYEDDEYYYDDEEEEKRRRPPKRRRNRRRKNRRRQQE